MARPRQMSDVDILKHARDVFLEHGPSASTQTVADRCGLSQAALFKRFGTKRDLMLKALLPPEHPPVLETLKLGPSDEPLEDQLVALGVTITTFFRQVVPCMAMLSASGLKDAHFFDNFEIPPPIRLQRAMTAWLEAAGDRLAIDDHRAVAKAFLGALHIRAFYAFIGQSGLPEDPEPYVRTLVHTFLHGIQESR